MSQVQSAEAAASASTLDSVGSILGGFLGGRRSTTALTSAARRHQSAQNRIAGARSKLDEATSRKAALEAELVAELDQIQQQWQQKAAGVTPLQVRPEKTDVKVLDVRLVWVPVAEPG